MRKIGFFLFLVALSCTGCWPQLIFEVPARPDVYIAPVTPEQVTPNNARNMAQVLEREIEQESKKALNPSPKR